MVIIGLAVIIADCKAFDTPYIIVIIYGINNLWWMETADCVLILLIWGANVPSMIKLIYSLIIILRTICTSEYVLLLWNIDYSIHLPPLPSCTSRGKAFVRVAFLTSKTTSTYSMLLFRIVFDCQQSSLLIRWFKESSLILRYWRHILCQNLPKWSSKELTIICGKKV